LTAATCNPLIAIRTGPPRLGFVRWQGRCLAHYGPDFANRSPKTNFRLTHCPQDTSPNLVFHGWAVYPDDRITPLSELASPHDANETRYLTSTIVETIQKECGDTKLLDLRRPSEVALELKESNRTDMGQAFAYDAENKWLVWKRDPSKRERYPTSCEKDAQLCYRVNKGPESSVDAPDDWEEWGMEPGMALTRCVKGDENEKWDFVESKLKPGELKSQIKGME
jgi:hypothetical protein